MKVQDLVFGLLFGLALWRWNAKLSVAMGLLCLLLAIPLFKFWIFFTAERLTWYAGAFFTLGVLLQLGLKTSPGWPNGLPGGGGSKNKRSRR